MGLGSVAVLVLKRGPGRPGLGRARAATAGMVHVSTPKDPRVAAPPLLRFYATSRGRSAHPPAPCPPARLPPAERSSLGRLAGPLGSAAMRAVLEPVVTSVVVLRDKVEQDRFVVRCASFSAAQLLIDV